MLRRAIILSLAAAVPLGAWTSSLAQTADHSPCKVKVRVIQGTNEGAPAAQRENRVEQHFVPSNSSLGPLQDDFLPEMESQLKTLPFSDYKILDSSEQDLVFDELGEFVVADGDRQLHQVSVTPSWADSDWVKMTVRWKGPDGAPLLASKLKVTNGKCLVLGTDAGDGTRSTIMSIRVKCPSSDMPPAQESASAAE